MMEDKEDKDNPLTTIISVLVSPYEIFVLPHPLSLWKKVSQFA